MNSPDQQQDTNQTTRLKESRFGNFGDSLFYAVTLIFAASVFVVTLLIGVQLIHASWPAIQHFGWRFLFTSTWDPVHQIYGAWPYIWGTLASSLLALMMAVPVAIGTAIFLVELCPKWLRGILSFMVELLAAVPSVVYGLWGIFVMIPVLQKIQGGIAHSQLSVLPIFAGAPTGYSMMAGALVLSIMILPIITAVTRDVIANVPSTQREAAFGLGSTHWEAVKGPVLRSARSGIMGAVILGLARALGETMAITMVIGNGKDASLSLLAPANTLASILANQFAEASGLQLPSLMYIALVLFGVAIIVNSIARLLLWNMSRGMKHA
ncbi:MAG: phosphate ABC transporter permease subunit PstC [Abditibacteriaceae bacterium]